MPAAVLAPFPTRATPCVKPTLVYSKATLKRSATEFINGFPGQVSYAVKANAEAPVLADLVEAGIACFDVASPNEMEKVRRIAPEAQLHYHNPVRSLEEIALAQQFGVRSYSVDRHSELDKLCEKLSPEAVEVCVRFRLPLQHAAYDFGAKFGAQVSVAIELLTRVQQRGFIPALCFHPGTQCTSPEAWAQYIQAAADIAKQAKVELQTLNVGGGFAADRGDQAPSLGQYFTRIKQACDESFGPRQPRLVCEPGRRMVADAFDYWVNVKAVDEDGEVFIDDGIYGLLSESRDIAPSRRFTVYDADGRERLGPSRPRVLFGPSCDSLDAIEGLALPDNIAQGDQICFFGMGAYSVAIASGFNGYGDYRWVDQASALGKPMSKPASD